MDEERQDRVGGAEIVDAASSPCVTSVPAGVALAVRLMLYFGDASDWAQQVVFLGSVNTGQL